jgi:predicted metal-dependent phosphotriesterase family hydrolase
MSFSILEHRQSPALATAPSTTCHPIRSHSPAGVRCLGAAGCLNPTQCPLQRIWLLCHWDLNPSPASRFVSADSLDDAEKMAQSNPYMSSIRVYEVMSK